MDVSQVRSMPLRKDDEVMVVRGSGNKNETGRVIAVYRKKYVVHIQRRTKDKQNGTGRLRMSLARQGHDHRHPPPQVPP